MKQRLLGATCACALFLPSLANAAFFDFLDWIDNNGEKGFENTSPFSLTDSGLTLTAKAFEETALPGRTDSHVYMDDFFNGFIGGMGVCSVLNTNDQCVPSSDDNVSIDAGSQEILSWEFSSAINGITLEMGESQHPPFDNRSFQYSIDNGINWLTGNTDANGVVALNFGGAINTVEFRTIGEGSENQFYMRTATTVVPVPAAAWLFASGLLGLVGVARRRHGSDV